MSDILTPWSEVNTRSLDVALKVQACKALTFFVSVMVDEKACSIALLTEDMVLKAENTVRNWGQRVMSTNHNDKRRIDGGLVPNDLLLISCDQACPNLCI